MLWLLIARVDFVYLGHFSSAFLPPEKPLAGVITRFFVRMLFAETAVAEFLPGRSASSLGKVRMILPSGFCSLLLLNYARHRTRRFVLVAAAGVFWHRLFRRCQLLHDPDIASVMTNDIDSVKKLLVRTSPSGQRRKRPSPYLSK